MSLAFKRASSHYNCLSPHQAVVITATNGTGAEKNSRAAAPVAAGISNRMDCDFTPTPPKSKKKAMTDSYRWPYMQTVGRRLRHGGMWALTQPRKLQRQYYCRHRNRAGLCRLYGAVVKYFCIALIVYMVTSIFSTLVNAPHESSLLRQDDNVEGADSSDDSVVPGALPNKVSLAIIAMFNHLIDVVGVSVQGYFTIFSECWDRTFTSLDTLIQAYINLIRDLCAQFMTLLFDVVDKSVHGYFTIFSECWDRTFTSLDTLIQAYINLIRDLCAQFMTLLFDIVDKSVQSYFRVFEGCWDRILTSLDTLMGQYMTMINELCSKMMSLDPNVLISFGTFFTIISISVLIFVYKIVTAILPWAHKYHSQRLRLCESRESRAEKQLATSPMPQRRTLLPSKHSKCLESPAW